MFTQISMAFGRLLVLSALFFLTSFNPISSKQLAKKDSFYLFFDLGDVLLTTTGSKFFGQNKGNFLLYLFKHGVPNSKALKKRLFELMDYRTGLPRGSATSGGEQIPGLMCEWLEGQISSQDFVNTITNIAPSDPFFKSKVEGRLLINMVKLMLPEQLVAMHTTTNALHLFQDCCKHDRERVCILSNWDKSSVSLLKAKFPQIFAQLSEDQIIFSGELGCKKPDTKIYQLAAQKLGVNPKHCILVDDQVSNIIAARKCGWKGILHLNEIETAKSLTYLYGFACKA